MGSWVWYMGELTQLGSNLHFIFNPPQKCCSLFFGLRLLFSPRNLPNTKSPSPQLNVIHGTCKSWWNWKSSTSWNTLTAVHFNYKQTQVLLDLKNCTYCTQKLSNFLSQNDKMIATSTIHAGVESLHVEKRNKQSIQSFANFDLVRFTICSFLHHPLTAWRNDFQSSLAVSFSAPPMESQDLICYLLWFRPTLIAQATRLKILQNVHWELAV